MEQSVGRVGAFQIARDLRAKFPAGGRVRGIAAYVDRLAVLDSDEHCARIGTIVRARRVHDALHRIAGNRIEWHAQIVRAASTDAFAAMTPASPIPTVT